MPWNPEQYNRFKKERDAPFNDLVRLVDVRPGLDVVDLGCGTGALTRLLFDVLPEANVLGIDSSPEMLQSAAQYVAPGLHFEYNRIENITGTWDVVFSHAAIQWVPDHEMLIPRLLELVTPGGQLAVQLPGNHTHPVHQYMRETAASEPYASALNGWQRESPVLPAERYAELLFRSGADNITVFEKVYPMLLPDADALVEWVKGTGLIPYMERLPMELRMSFLDDYRARLHELWGDGDVFYGFRRILFAATKSAG